MNLVKRLYDKANLMILTALVSASAHADLFDDSVTTQGSSQNAQNMADTGVTTVKAFGPLILSGFQLVALGLGGLTFWFLYQNGQPQNEGRGFMKKALYAGMAAGGMYFSPRFLGMAGRTLLPA